MRKISLGVLRSILFLMTFMTIYCFDVNCQDTITVKNDTLIYRNNSTYFEFAGNTVSSICINMEFSLYKNLNKKTMNTSNFNLRVGLGPGIWASPPGAILMVSWEYGKFHRIEAGSGIIYSPGNLDSLWYMTVFDGTKYNIISTFTLGYKYVSLDSDWLLRAGFTPRFSFEGKFWGSMGFSFGWTW